MRYWPRTRDKSLPFKGFARRCCGHRVRCHCSNPGRGDRRRSADGRAGGVRSHARRWTGRLSSPADGIRDYGAGHPLPVMVANSNLEWPSVDPAAQRRRSSPIWARPLCARCRRSGFRGLTGHPVDRSHGGPGRSRRRYRFQRNRAGSARAAYMITDFREAPIGTNGAISVVGTLAGCLAACLVAWVSACLRRRKLELDAGDCPGWNCRHVFRQHPGSDVGKLWQNGQRCRQLCEHGVRRRSGADCGEGDGKSGYVSSGGRRHPSEARHESMLSTRCGAVLEAQWLVNNRRLTEE